MDKIKRDCLIKTNQLIESNSKIDCRVAFHVSKINNSCKIFLFNYTTKEMSNKIPSFTYDESFKLNILYPVLDKYSYHGRLIHSDIRKTSKNNIETVDLTFHNDNKNILEITGIDEVFANVLKERAELINSVKYQVEEEIERLNSVEPDEPYKKVLIKESIKGYSNIIFLSVSMVATIISTLTLLFLFIKR